MPRRPEREVIDEIGAQDDGEHGFLDLGGRLSRIRDHVYVVMTSGVVPRGFEEWQHLEEVLREVHGGKVYRRKRTTEGGRGAGGSRGGKGGGMGGGRGGVIRG